MTQLKLHFIPVFDDAEYVDSAVEYDKIWKKEGKSIVSAFEKVTGLSFFEDRIAVVVWNWISNSGQSTRDIMKLRFNLEPEDKLATLIHELGHRLVMGRVKKDAELDAHGVLNLFLYDVWVELYGEDFAKRAVEKESALPRTGEYYATAWKQALKLSVEERKNRLREILI